MVNVWIGAYLASGAVLYGVLLRFAEITAKPYTVPRYFWLAVTCMTWPAAVVAGLAYAVADYWLDD